MFWVDDEGGRAKSRQGRGHRYCEGEDRMSFALRHKIDSTTLVEGMRHTAPRSTKRIVRGWGWGWGWGWGQGAVKTISRSSACETQTAQYGSSREIDRTDPAPTYFHPDSKYFPISSAYRGAYDGKAHRSEARHGRGVALRVVAATDPQVINLPRGVRKNTKALQY